MLDFWFTYAEGDYFAPIEDAVDGGETYLPSKPLPGWASEPSGVWTVWSAPGQEMPDQGWKIHVSTAQDRAQHTLDVVARACRERGVPFKHLRTTTAYLVIHHKQAARSQSGKFCAIYPPTEAVAQELLDALSAELAGETGPYILSDRRYGDSGVVFYRYGAFRNRERLLLDGTRQPIVRNAAGEDVPDVRTATFVPPAGITDPFAAPDPAAAPTQSGPVILNDRFEVVAAIRHANSGGAYRAKDLATGRSVFVKEARALCGLLEDGTDAMQRLRREADMLRYIHGRRPGLCPEPIDSFAQWEHEYLVTEYVEGTPFLQWVAASTVIGRLSATSEQRDTYLSKAQRVIDAAREAVEGLREIGVRFGDLSHGNVVVQDGERARLIDFEAANMLSEQRNLLGTAGYKPPPSLVAEGVEDDDYGLAGLAQFALFPLHEPLSRDPHGRLELWRRDLEREGPVPDDLWRLATRFLGLGSESGSDSDSDSDSDPGSAGGVGQASQTAYVDSGRDDLPTAAELDASPQEALRRLADGIGRGLLAMARPEGEGWVFPPPVEGYAANPHCVRHGTAGVLHALRASGAPIPLRLIERFRSDALAAADDLPPGLHAGTAGIAWVLAELGCADEAIDLLDKARWNPLTFTSAGLAHGGSGVGMAHLALHAMHGRDEHLLVACKLGNAFARDQRADVLAGAGTPGLDEGLAGTALFLHCLGRYTGEQHYLDGATALLHAELDRADALGGDMLVFRDGGGTRNTPYLGLGSSGVVVALSRAAATTGEGRFLDAIPRILRYSAATCSVTPGLYAGVAGWAFASAEHAAYAGGPDDRAAALRIATALAKYAVRHPSGLRIIESLGSRYHSDLGSGGAGVLLALHRVLGDPAAHLFTVDRPRREPDAEPELALAAAGVPTTSVPI